MKALLILDFPLQTPCLAKFLFWSYCPKWPILANQIAGFFKASVKKIGGQVDFLFLANYQRFLQVSAIAFGWRGQACQGVPKISKITSLQ